MGRKQRFTKEQQKWWQNQLTKYYQECNGNVNVKMDDVLWCWIDEWVTNYEKNICDLKAKIIERFYEKK